MPYTMKSEDVFSFATVHGDDTKQIGDELNFQYCPYCHGGESHDKYTFSVNLKSGAYKCLRASCGKQGHFVELARDFEYRLEFEESKTKQYRALPQKPVSANQKAIDYLACRGISREICEKYKITVRNDNNKILAFPFYDENGVMQFVKYRNTDFVKGRDKNKEWCERDTKPILYGMMQCEDFDTLIITEGQIDSLSVSECGINNAVSVPTGAKGFTWVTHCWDWLVKFKRVIVFGDNENGKITLVDELSKRLPRLEVVKREYYLGEKDANDILRKYGKQAIIDAVQSAAIQPVQRVKELADVKRVDMTALPHIKTGISEIDRVIGGIFMGQVALLTGKRGEGKSTFMSQIIAEALNQDYKVFAYSGELADYNFKSWLDIQLAGVNNIVTNKNAYGDDWYVLTDNVVSQISEWYRGRAYIYDNSAVSEADDEYSGVLSTVEQAIQRYGINFVCVDNLMTALDIDAKDDLYRAQSKFVQRLKQIAVKYDVAVLLVAHPKKTTGDITNDDVSGSSDITNRVDVVMSYSRAKGENAYDSDLIITKNRLTGTLVTSKEPIHLAYSKKSKRITSYKYGNSALKYGWESACFEELDLNGELPF